MALKVVVVSCCLVSPPPPPPCVCCLFSTPPAPPCVGCLFSPPPALRSVCCVVSVSQQRPPPLCLSLLPAAADPPPTPDRSCRCNCRCYRRCMCAAAENDAGWACVYPACPHAPAHVTTPVTAPSGPSNDLHSSATHRANPLERHLRLPRRTRQSSLRDGDHAAILRVGRPRPAL